MESHFDPVRFEKFTREQAKIIREQPLDKWQIQAIYEDFVNVLRYATIVHHLPSKDFNGFIESVLELNIAMQIAYSNYRTENKTLWRTIIGWAVSKIPQIDLNQFKNKK
ncbi:MAG: hypothetical protein ABIG95_05125 [Candidatus Woesearchaeota archaeon]